VSPAARRLAARRPAATTGPRRRQVNAQARRDPFASLGLDAGPGLTDDQVRAAWRRIAAATHPDRADGGDQDRYAAAAAAYAELRTSYGRGEALAGLAAGPDEALAGGGAGPAASRAVRFLARLPGRIARGRPVRLALRTAAAGAAGWAALAAGAPPGAGPAVAAGAITWLILAGLADLAP
jgi:hypothetical protein